MNSMLAAPLVSGAQRPNICHVPPYEATSGLEVIEVCELAGLHLDEWQQFVLMNALGERAGGKWAAFEVGLTVSRQNGKGGILEARELGGLFVLGERLLVHSAHQFDTSLEAFRRLLELIESAPDLDQMVKRVSRSHGEEGIELKTGQRIRFRTRTKGGGRGFSGDWLGLDEDMILPAAMHGALLPTLSARPNPQVWYTGSAVDQEVHEHGLVKARIRERGIAGEDPALAYFEWSADADVNSGDLAEVVCDEDAWAQANPALGIRISMDYVGNEQRSLDQRTFAVERLGIGDWPNADGTGEQVIPVEVWRALTDEASKVENPVRFAFDVTPSRDRAAIVVAGRRKDKLAHVEVVEHKRGTGWVAARLAELVKAHAASEVICDAKGPAGSLIPEIEQAGVKVRTVNGSEYAQACGVIYDMAEQGAFRHLGTPELEAAVKGAAKRPLGDAWAWSRKSSAVDISPLVACTLALWSATSHHEREPMAAWV
jgi:hypothetical protein